MIYIGLFLLGVVVGGICMLVYLSEQHRKMAAQAKAAEALARRANETLAEVARREAEAGAKEAELAEGFARFNARVIKYDELLKESAMLKRDLQNIDVNVNKLELDRELQQRRQAELDERATALGKRYLTETVKAVVASVGPNNFAACKQRLANVIEWCREAGFSVSAAEEQGLLERLKAEFEREVKIAIDREEQARITAQMREEQRLQRDAEREIQRADRERAVIQAALDQALAAAKDQHTAEVQKLQAQLAEAIASSARAKSLAEQTKAGNVYVISNIGSFGDGVFKVGMTRRLEPLERVKELSDASVPFPFDIHMMISCDDAPALENALHRKLHRLRVNKCNPKKEFFRSDIKAIAEVVEAHHGKVEYKADPEAAEYRQSLSMSDQDADFIESVYDEAEDEKVAADSAVDER
jgi:hypothetical protein